MKIAKYIILIVIIIALSLILIKTETKITKVIDGDTIIVNNNRTIRLARIDTPEYYEAGYQEAKSFMGQFKGETVKLKCEDELGYYGREICEVYHQGISINQLLLRENLAEIY